MVLERSTNSWLRVRRGASPLILSIPHAGTEIPAELLSDLRSRRLACHDTDWFLPELYEFVAELDATVIRTTLSRTVIDVNRDPSGASLYPGMATTGLCPLETFDGQRLYVDDREPDAAATRTRREAFHAPYHATIGEQIARLRGRHARVVVYDAHAIRSRVPRLFEGTLPHLNIGTNDARSCDPRLTSDIVAAIRGSDFTHVVDGRFKGGYITRRWGRPDEGVHALQMEIACRAYMSETEAPPTTADWRPSYDPRRALPLQAVLRTALQACVTFARRTD